MILRALFGELVVDHLVDNKIAQIVEQPFFGKEPFDQCFHRAGGVGLDADAVNRLPRRVPLKAAVSHAMQRCRAVGDDTEAVKGEELGNIDAIVAELIVRARHIGVAVPWAFEFKEHHRQPIEIDDQVGTPRIAPIAAVNWQLVDDEPVVAFGLCKVGEVDMFKVRFVVDFVA